MVFDIKITRPIVIQNLKNLDRQRVSICSYVLPSYYLCRHRQRVRERERDKEGGREREREREGLRKRRAESEWRVSSRGSDWAGSEGGSRG